MITAMTIFFNQRTSYLSFVFINLTGVYCATEYAQMTNYTYLTSHYIFVMNW